jgi:hypothetical protein
MEQRTQTFQAIVRVIKALLRRERDRSDAPSELRIADADMGRWCRIPTAQSCTQPNVGIAMATRRRRIGFHLDHVSPIQQLVLHPQ